MPDNSVVQFKAVAADGHTLNPFDRWYVADEDTISPGPSHQLFKIELGAEETHVFKFEDETDNSTIPEEQTHIP